MHREVGRRDNGPIGLMANEEAMVFILSFVYCGCI